MPDWLVWLIVSGALAAAETSSMAFVLLMVSGGAAAGAVTAAAGGPLLLQIVVALLGTVALLWLVRPVALRHLHPTAQTVSGSAALVGREATVLSVVTRDDGRVRLNGGEWSARAADPNQNLLAGALVTVIAIDGATAVVWQDPLG